MNQEELNDRLIEAVESNDTKQVEVLIEIGADVHIYNDYALELASAKGHLELVKLLMQNGADVHADNDYALELASNNGHKEVVKLLKKHGAKIN